MQKLMEWYPKLASKYHVPVRVVEILADSLQITKGEEARFDIPELGGKGIWKSKQGAHIGNGFNEALNQRASELCLEIASLLRVQDRDETTILSSLDETIAMMPVSIEPPVVSMWWSEHLGKEPDLVGNAGTLRYAYFAAQHRLVIQNNLRNRLFDTEGMKITDVRAGRSPGFFNTVVRTDRDEFAITKLREVTK